MEIASVKTLESLLAVYPILNGEPNEKFLPAAYFKNKECQPAKDLDPARDVFGLIFFAPVLPTKGGDIQILIESIKQICADIRFETRVLLIQPNPRTFLVIIPLIFNKQDSVEIRRAQQTYDQLCGLLKPQHYQQYRCCTPQMEKILDGSPSYRHLMQTIKSALDSTGTTAPGRYGV